MNASATCIIQRMGFVVVPKQSLGNTFTTRSQILREGALDSSINLLEERYQHPGCDEGGFDVSEGVYYLGL